MKRRNFISLLAVMAAAGALSGCGSSSSAAGAGSTAGSGEAADRLEAAKARGTLIVALEGAWSPWCYHDDTDTLVGYDVEVSRAIAQYMGLEPEYVEGEWDGLFAGLEAGRYDIVCNGVEVTEERAKSYDFSEPYAYIHTALAVRADDDSITCFEDLAEVLGVDTLDETIQMLLAGRVDATLNADVSFYDYLNVHPDAAFKLVDETDEASHVCIPVRKGGGSDTLLAAVNEAIDALRADGTLAEISEKYFGSDISSEA